MYEAIALNRALNSLGAFAALVVSGGSLVILGLLVFAGARRDRETESKILGTTEPDSSASAYTEDRRISHPPPPSPSGQASQQTEFDRLWEGAQTRLSMYHQLAVIQGRQSFRMLLLFSGLGFGLLTFVVWKATEVHSAPGGLALGAAGVAGAALSGYIGQTFMRAYRDANERLIDYFAEPLDMSRLLAAERLLKSVSAGERDRVAETIINSALGGGNRSSAGTKRRRSRMEHRPRPETLPGPTQELAREPGAAPRHQGVSQPPR